MCASSSIHKHLARILISGGMLPELCCMRHPCTLQSFTRKPCVSACHVMAWVLFKRATVSTRACLKRHGYRHDEGGLYLNLSDRN